MERSAGMIGKAFQNVGLLMGDAIVDDDVDGVAGWDGALDGADEADERLAAMAPHAAPDHRSVEDDDRGEQRRPAAAPAVAGLPPAFALRERKAERHAVGGLNLAFLSIAATTACFGGRLRSSAEGERKRPAPCRQMRTSVSHRELSDCVNGLGGRRNATFHQRSGLRRRRHGAWVRQGAQRSRQARRQPESGGVRRRRRFAAKSA